MAVAPVGGLFSGNVFLRTIGILTSDSCLSQVCCGLEEEYGSLPMVDTLLFCFKTIPLVLTHP